jgi:hypothetical protein
MLTVISLRELEHLWERKELTRSINTEFIKDSLMQQAIINKIHELTGEATPQNGFIAALYGVRHDLDRAIFEKTTSAVLRQLALPPDPIGLLIPDSLASVKIDRESFMEALGEGFDLSDPQIKEFVYDMFQAEADPHAGTYSFAFLSRIKCSYVSEYLYSAALEDRVQALKAKQLQSDAVFTRTSIFT